MMGEWIYIGWPRGVGPGGAPCWVGSAGKIRPAKCVGVGPGPKVGRQGMGYDIDYQKYNILHWNHHPCVSQSINYKIV